MKLPPLPEHVCGLQGFGAIDDECPACRIPAMNGLGECCDAPAAPADATVERVMELADTMAQRLADYLHSLGDGGDVRVEYTDSRAALRAGVERIVTRIAALEAALKEMRDAEQCLGINETLIDRIDALLEGKTNGDDGTYLHSPDGGPL